MKLVVIFALIALAHAESEPNIIVEYGKFSEVKHEMCPNQCVSGKVSGEGTNRKEIWGLIIKDFNYSGEGM